MPFLQNIGKILLNLVRTLNWREYAEEAAMVVAAKAIDEVKADIPAIVDEYGPAIEDKLADLLPDEVEGLVLAQIRPLIVHYSQEILDAASVRILQALDNINPADNVASAPAT